MSDRDDDFLDGFRITESKVAVRPGPPESASPCPRPARATRSNLCAQLSSGDIADPMTSDTSHAMTWAEDSGGSIGDQYQAELPGDEVSVDRGDTLLWSPDFGSGFPDFPSACSLTSYLERASAVLAVRKVPLGTSCEEVALRSLVDARGDWDCALESLQCFETPVQLQPWDDADLLKLEMSLEELGGGNLREIHSALRGEGVSATFASLVAEYYAHFYLTKERVRKPPEHHLGGAGVGGIGVPQSLAQMISYGLLDPGKGVLSVAVTPQGPSCEQAFADLLPNGMIRYAPNGKRPQLFSSPARFARSILVCQLSLPSCSVHHTASPAWPVPSFFAHP